MQQYQITSFISELKDLESFIDKFSRDYTKNPNRLNEPFYVDNIEKIEETILSLESNINSLKRFAKIYDMELYNSLIDYLAINKPTGHLLEYSIFAKQAIISSQNFKLTRNKFNFLLYSVITGLIKSMPNDFKPIQYIIDDYKLQPLELLKTIKHLQIFSKQIDDIYYDRYFTNNEFFEPENVNHNTIIELIEKAIREINDTANIDYITKERLCVYLTEVKTDIVNGTPIWKKVIGACVIVATILSGIAAAPDAINTLNDAVKHITGYAKSNIINKVLPEYKLEETVKLPFETDKI